MDKIITKYADIPRMNINNSNNIKHIICEGARFHVISYDTNGLHCSEFDCIINKKRRIISG